VSYHRRAVPVHKPEPTPDPVRKYRVLSKRWQRPQGEVFDLAFPPALEKALLDGGIIELVPDAPKFGRWERNTEDRPLKSADKEG
jgi:hypothetical protein